MYILIITYREIGIGGFNLSIENIKQLSLFETLLQDDPWDKNLEALQQAIDEIKEKFDFTTIQKVQISRALTEGSRVLERNKMIGGHTAAGGE
ncbi:UmuC protein [Lactococcus petauri]|uniref:UmuC protein n=1 Tax=Lactococcus petauri TaxID=1940789 RepID=UPI003854F7C6